MHATNVQNSYVHRQNTTEEKLKRWLAETEPKPKINKLRSRFGILNQDLPNLLTNLELKREGSKELKQN